MLASRFVSTSDTSTSSMCARQALSEVSLRSSTEAKVLPPFTCHSRAYPIGGGERIQDAAKVSGILHTPPSQGVNWPDHMTVVTSNSRLASLPSGKDHP